MDECIESLSKDEAIINVITHQSSLFDQIGEVQQLRLFHVVLQPRDTRRVITGPVDHKFPSCTLFLLEIQVRKTIPVLFLQDHQNV
jgi:hypothetical protein